jgi:hypothetical protein
MNLRHVNPGQIRFSPESAPDVVFVLHEPTFGEAQAAASAAGLRYSEEAQAAKAAGTAPPTSDQYVNYVHRERFLRGVDGIENLTLEGAPLATAAEFVAAMPSLGAGALPLYNEVVNKLAELATLSPGETKNS